MLDKRMLMLITALLFLQPVSLTAQPESTLDSYYRLMPSCKVGDMPGKIRLMEADSEYSYEFKAFDELPVKLSLENDCLSIDNSTEVELPAHLVELGTDIETTLPFFNLDKTYLRLGVSPSFYGHDWDFRSHSFRIPSRYLLIYQPSPKWTFIAGVGFYPEFDYGIVPLLGLIYKPNDRLSFNLTPDRPNISYSLNDKVTLFAEASLRFEEYEVPKDDFTNAVLQYRQKRLGCGIKYQVNKFIQASLQAGGVFDRYLEYKDSLGKVDIKNGVYTEFRVVINI